MHPPHKGFIVDVVEYEDRNYLELRVYRPNIEDFSDPQKVQLAEYLYTMQAALKATGIECHLQGVEDAPPNRNSISPV